MAFRKPKPVAGEESYEPARPERRRSPSRRAAIIMAAAALSVSACAQRANQPLATAEPGTPAAAEPAPVETTVPTPPETAPSPQTPAPEAPSPEIPTETLPSPENFATGEAYLRSPERQLALHDAMTSASENLMIANRAGTLGSSRFRDMQSGVDLPRDYLGLGFWSITAPLDHDYKEIVVTVEQIDGALDSDTTTSILLRRADNTSVSLRQPGSYPVTDGQDGSVFRAGIMDEDTSTTGMPTEQVAAMESSYLPPADLAAIDAEVYAALGELQAMARP